MDNEVKLMDTTRALIDLTGAVSRDPELADWYDVDELIDLLPNPTPVLRNLIRYAHKEWL